MKKNMSKIAALLLTACLGLTACDPGFEEECLMVNNSNHTVTIIPGNYSWYDYDADSTHIYKNSSYTLKSGEEVMVSHESGIGYASLERGTYEMKYYLGDSVIFQFEDNRQIVFHPKDTIPSSPYNFSVSNYTYEEKVSRTGSSRGNAFYGKLTFFITDDHYNQAQ
ncbi:MAG: hypothetical protein J5792_04280 [Bacteroidales bacterium]|nr:hypothetical protein [Bacteroidales bacterium]